MKISRPLTLAAVSASLLATALAAAPVVAATDSAAPAQVARARARARAPRPQTCDVSAVADRLGPTSVTSLKVTGVRCATGISVVRAFQSCRLKNGVSGRCVRLVQGYACGEIRQNGPTQFTATATCRNRSKTVVHRYTQTIA